jgi:quercetin dioxygenase-like cupin family protein
VSSRLDRPFTVEPLFMVGPLAVSIFVCQGQMNWHKHPDQDELFLVHEGVISLDTLRGSLTLHSEELAVVPKGLGHRSGSQLRSVVLLVRPAVLVERTNGHRLVSVPPSAPPLERVRLARSAAALLERGPALAVARVEGFDVLLFRVNGRQDLGAASPCGSPYLALRGSLELALRGEAPVPLPAGSMALVPPGATHTLTAQEPGLVLTLTPATIDPE